MAKNADFDSVKTKPVLALKVSRDRIKPFKDQPREFFDPEKLQDLAENMRLNGQLHPLIVRKLKNNSRYDYELIDGQRRWHAAPDAGLKELDVVVVGVRNAQEQFAMSAAANACRESLSHLELSDALKRLIGFEDMNGLNQGQKIAKAAATLGCKPFWANQLLRLQKLSPDVRALMSPLIEEDKRLGTSKALLISDLPLHLQLSMARSVLKEGLTSRATQTRVLEKMPDHKKNGKGRKLTPAGEQARLETFIEDMEDRTRHFMTPIIQQLLVRLSTEDRQGLAEELRERRTALSGLIAKLEAQAPVKV